MCCIEQSNSDRISLLQTFGGMLLYSFNFQTAAYLEVTEHKQRVACNIFLEQQVNHTIFTDNTWLTKVSQVVGYPDWFMVNLLIHSHPSSFLLCLPIMQQICPTVNIVILVESGSRCLYYSYSEVNKTINQPEIDIIVCPPIYYDCFFYSDSGWVYGITPSVKIPTLMVLSDLWIRIIWFLRFTDSNIERILTSSHHTY